VSNPANQSQVSSDRRLARRAGIVAAMLAVASAAQGVALLAICSAVFDPLAGTKAMILAVSLFAAALGAMLPHQLVVHLIRSTWARARGSVPPDGPAGQSSPPQPESSLWLALAVVLLATGLAAVGTLAAVRLVELLYAYLVNSFLWRPVTLRFAQCVLLIPLLAPLWSLYGISLTCAYAVRAAHSPPGRTDPGLVAWLLPALAAGLALARLVVLPYGTATHALLIGTGSLFLAAVFAILAAGASERASGPPREYPEHPAPEQAETTGLLVVCLGLWGVTVGLFLAAPKDLGFEDHRLRDLGLYLPLVVMGLAAAAAARLPGRLARLPAFALGLLLASLLALVSLLAVERGLLLWTGASFLAFSAVMGAALAFGRAALSARLVTESLSLAELAASVLTGVAVGLGLGMAWLLPAFGWSSVILVLGLLAAVTAGLLAAGDRHAHPAMSVALIGLALVLIVGFAIVPAPAGLYVAATPAHGDRAARDPVSDDELLRLGSGLVPADAESFNTMLITADRTAVRYTCQRSNDGLRIGSPRLYRPAWLGLQAGFDRFSLLVLGPSRLDDDHQDVWSIEFFDLMRARMISGGVSVVVVPLSDVTHEHLVTVVATFAAVFRQGRCVLGRLAGRPAVMLLGWVDSRPTPDWPLFPPAGEYYLCGYGDLLPSDKDLPVNSLRHPRLAAVPVSKGLTYRQVLAMAQWRQAGDRLGR